MRDEHRRRARPPARSSRLRASRCATRHRATKKARRASRATARARAPGQCHALLLAAGERLRRTLAIGTRQADEFKQLIHAIPRATLGARQPEHDVLRHRKMRKHRALLRHIADAPCFRRHMQTIARDEPSVDIDRAAIGALEAARARAEASSCHCPTGRAARAMSRPRHDRSMPCNTACPSNDFVRPLMRRSLTSMRSVRARRIFRAMRTAAADAPERDADEQRRIRRGGGEGERGRIAPHLRCERARADRREQQGRVEFGDDGDEDHRRGRAETGASKRQDERLGSLAPAEAERARAVSSSRGCACVSAARTLTSAAA